jgi:hypothetical protein
MWSIDSLDKFSQELQEHFTDGLAIIIGSGLSVGEGLPGMWDLGKQLKEEVPKRLKSTNETWNRILELLEADVNLEEALTKAVPDKEVEEHIVNVTADFIQEKEKEAISKVFSGNKQLKLTGLLNNILITAEGLPIITTNYDRLVEVAVEAAGLGADTAFVGNYAGLYNPQESKFSFCRGVEQRLRKATLQHKRRAIVCKPHGSLDWYMLGDNPVRSSFELDAPKLIITPGLNKYRTGYERPFDGHREIANKHIDLARQYLIIGYGFGDSHLETHLAASIRSGKRTLILTYSLSDKAAKIVAECPNTVAITIRPNDSSTAQIVHSTGTRATLDSPVWDLSEFVTKFLKP